MILIHSAQTTSKPYKNAIPNYGILIQDFATRTVLEQSVSVNVMLNATGFGNVHFILTIFIHSTKF